MENSPRDGKLDFLIIGAQKAGTTSLREYFNQFPDHFNLPSSELHFWNRESEFRSGEGLPEYFEHFKRRRPSQLIGEKCPSYLPSIDAPGRVKEFFPQIKLVTVLRNPADRALSTYLHGLRVGAIPKSRSFSQAIREYEALAGKAYGDVVSRGFYIDQIEHWLEFFKREQMKFITFESMTSDPDKCIAPVMRFLVGKDVIGESGRTIEFPKVNTAKKSRYPYLVKMINRFWFISYSKKQKWIRKTGMVEVAPEMSVEDREFLHGIYAENNKRLRELLGSDFGWGD